MKPSSARKLPRIVFTLIVGILLSLHADATSLMGPVNPGHPQNTDLRSYDFEIQMGEETVLIVRPKGFQQIIAHVALPKDFNVSSGLEVSWIPDFANTGVWQNRNDVLAVKNLRQFLIATQPNVASRVWNVARVESVPPVTGTNTSFGPLYRNSLLRTVALSFFTDEGGINRIHAPFDTPTNHFGFSAGIDRDMRREVESLLTSFSTEAQSRSERIREYADYLLTLESRFESQEPGLLRGIIQGARTPPPKITRGPIVPSKPASECGAVFSVSNVIPISR